MIRLSSGMCKVEMACVLYDHTSQGARDFSRKTGECIGKRWAHSNTLAIFLAVCQATPSSPLRYGKRACGESSLRQESTKSLRCLIDGTTLHGTEDTMSLVGSNHGLQRCEVLVAFWNQVSMESLSHQIMSKVTSYNSTIQILPKSLALWILILLYFLHAFCPKPWDSSGQPFPSGQLSSSSRSWLHPSMVLASGVNVGVSENVGNTPKNPMVLLIIIPIKWL